MKKSKIQVTMTMTERGACRELMASCRGLMQVLDRIENPPPAHLDDPSLLDVEREWADDYRLKIRELAKAIGETVSPKAEGLEP